MLNFWESLKKPILALAPMEEVTDTVFREIVMSVSIPESLHVVFTEFTSVDGLCHEKGHDKVAERLWVNESERRLLQASHIKLVAQIWGSDPNNFYKTAQEISRIGLFDGIDINMGCPVKKVVKKKSCSALINHPELAKDIIRATAEGCNLPVSVKTRIGFNSIITESWIDHLLDANPQCITVHGRTQKMASEGVAMWSEIAKAVELRDRRRSTTVILGNGDVDSCADAMLRIDKHKTDGAMIGTGIFRNPWLFNVERANITIEERFRLMKKHIELFRDTWEHRKNYNTLKRFYKIYLSGIPDASSLRDRFMRTTTYEEALRLIATF